MRKAPWYSYKSLFGISEIESSPLLKALFYCITFSFYVTFSGWIASHVGTIHSIIRNTYVCPPYFTQCKQLFFYDSLPWSYTENILYVLLYLVLLWGIVSAVRGDWVRAHQAILIAFLWKVVWVFLLSYGSVGNFDYYDMILAFVFLFAREKIYFAKVSFVWMYFMASTIKFHEGWIFGTYFTTLITGAPFVIPLFIPLITNIVIVMQVAGSWFLLSSNKIVQKMSYLFFFVFHVYSGFLVSYRYIAISIPALYVLFAKNPDFDETTEHRFKVLPLEKKTMIGYAFLMFLFVGQMIAVVIPGDQKETLEGNYYGMFMFEANHQCISNATVYDSTSTVLRTLHEENHTANNRCDPYQYYYVLHAFCQSKDVHAITWTFDHSINGHPYKRIVDEDNICTKSYKSFAHNEWIRIGKESATINTPVFKNGFNSSTDVSYLQIPANPYVNDELLARITTFYWILWSVFLCLSIGILGYKTYRKYW